jgi:hypothetical protein
VTEHYLADDALREAAVEERLEVVVAGEEVVEVH